MKNLIALTLIFLCSCTTETTTVEKKNEPAPTPPSYTSPDDTDGGKDDSKTDGCKLVRTVWGGNCRLDEYQCPDGAWRLDSKCYPPDWELPHKNDPDPPFNQESK